MNRRTGLAFLTTDPDTGAATGHLRVPCSRYGTTSRDCAEVAWRLAWVLSRETGEVLTEEDLNYAMGLVVNDHDDVAYIIRSLGDRKYR